METPTKICQACWDYGLTIQAHKRRTNQPVSSRPVIICQPEQCESQYHKITNGGN